MPSKSFFAVITVLIAGGVLAALGTLRSDVNLSSVLGLWSDTVRDADQIGMRLTRVSDSEEMKIGVDLARSIASHEDAAGAAYVTAVAQSLLSHTRRRGIRYQFHVIESNGINAFALPGGQIFVTASFLDFAQSEAELAAALGHEISHVDLRHCIERYQYQLTLKRAGVPNEFGWLVETAHRLATMGFSQDQEREADAQGTRMAIEAGYDPSAAAALFSRMEARFAEASMPRATTPLGEVTGAIGGAFGDYFRTHPPSEERARNMRAMAARHRGSLYVGKENLRRRIPRSQREFPSEFESPSAWRCSPEDSSRTSRRLWHLRARLTRGGWAALYFDDNISSEANCSTRSNRNPIDRWRYTKDSSFRDVLRSFRHRSPQVSLWRI